MIALPGTTAAVPARAVRSGHGSTPLAFRQEAGALVNIDRALRAVAGTPEQRA